MQVKQTLAKDLKRDYDVTIGADEVSKKIQARLKAIAKKMKLPGFRPGKVPMDIVRQRHGKNVLGEVLQLLVDETSRQALSKEKVRPAMTPKIEVKSFEEGKDLHYTMQCEILPEVPERDVSKLKISRPKVTLSAADKKEAMAEIAARSKDHQPPKKARAAKKGDVLVIDFKGFVDDTPFDGGEGSGYRLELGSNTFIPGFEEQLIGAKAKQKITVNVAFPKEYHAQHLAGKDARFEVTVNEVLEPVEAKLDDALAQKFGLKDLKALEQAVQEQLEGEVAHACRTHAKKSLFDAMDEAYDFPLPEVMVAQEFDSIWKQVEEQRKKHPAGQDAKADDQALKAQYQQMAERRVKLGIVLSDTGNKHDVKIANEDIQKAVMAEAQRYPGQEQEVIRYYTEKPENLEALHGPILEEKVVDYLLEKVQVADQKMTLEALRELEVEESISEIAAQESKKKSGAKKAAPKKAAAKKAPAKKEGAAKKAPAKKPATKKVAPKKAAAKKK